MRDEGSIESDPSLEPLEENPSRWVMISAVLVGLVLAIAVLASPLASFLFHPLLVIIHELGHTIFFWLYGYPAIPAFDFVDGGGLAMAFERQQEILYGLWVVSAVVWLLWWRNRVVRYVLPFLLGFHIISSQVILHEVIIAFMGHGTELIFAGIFFYRAFTGVAVHHWLERATYAFGAFYISLWNIHWIYNLYTSQSDQAEYAAYVQSGVHMDFAVIAYELLHVSISSVILTFLILSFLPLPLAAGLAWFRDGLEAFWIKITLRDGGA